MGVVVAAFSEAGGRHAEVSFTVAAIVADVFLIKTVCRFPLLVLDYWMTIWCLWLNLL